MALNTRIDRILDETDALRTQNPVAAILYLFVLAFAVTIFLH